MTSLQQQPEGVNNADNGKDLSCYLSGYPCEEGAAELGAGREILVAEAQRAEHALAVGRAGAVVAAPLELLARVAAEAEVRIYHSEKQEFNFLNNFYNTSAVCLEQRKV